MKLNANKNNKIQFDIDIQSTGDETLTGYFRLMHEGIEYGFPVHVLGNRNKAEVKIPALKKLLPNLTEGTIDAKLEFIDGCDYIKVWEDKVEIDIPRLSIKTEGIKVSEDTIITAAPVIEVSDEIFEKVKTGDKDDGFVIDLSPRPAKKKVFGVSDEAWEAAKKNPQKSLI